LFTTFPTLFSGIYGWGPGISGLAFIGPGIGFLGATMAGALLLSKIYLKVSHVIACIETPAYYSISYLPQMVEKANLNIVFP
jgi:hypothetical protein